MLQHIQFYSIGPRTPVKAGSELFTFYGYKKGDFPNDFPWYFELQEPTNAIKTFFDQTDGDKIKSQSDKRFKH